MKTRNGFVSNSSSSSFVLLGWAIDYDEKDEEILNQISDRFNEEDGIIAVLRGDEDGVPEDTVLVGTMLAQFDDQDGYCTKSGLDSMLERIVEVEKELEKHGFEFDENAALHVGSRMS